MTLNDSYSAGCKLFEILRQVRSTHHGDLEEYLILYSLVLADTYEKQVRPIPEGAAPRRHGLNLLSVSEITGIPRETVRRKIARLIEAGSVGRSDGLYRYVGDDRSDDITTRIFRDLPSFRAA